MIKPKQSQVIEVPETEQQALGEVIDYNNNPLNQSYLAVREILSELTVDPNDPASPPLFKTIKLDNGQLARIKRSTKNLEYAFGFPAVLIHFINVYYNVGQSNTYDGKGTMRIHYILNRLNNSDDVVEAEGFAVFQRINVALQKNFGRFPALTRRFQLAYWDMPLTFDNGLQPFWIDYDIWFRDVTTDYQRDYVERYIVIPPFTNHSDQIPEHNPDHHPNHQTPTFDESSGFEIPGRND